MSHRQHTVDAARRAAVRIGAGRTGTGGSEQVTAGSRGSSRVGAPGRLAGGVAADRGGRTVGTVTGAGAVLWIDGPPADPDPGP